MRPAYLRVPIPPACAGQGIPSSLADHDLMELTGEADPSASAVDLCIIHDWLESGE